MKYVALNEIEKKFLDIVYCKDLLKPEDITSHEINQILSNIPD
jgi:hypothetical protein